MAFGQTDPARLEGSALRRWYLRSPAEIEDERLRRADQARQQFYGGIRALREPDSPNLANRLVRVNASDEAASASRVVVDDGSAAPVKATAFQGAKPQGRGENCLSCHIPPPPPLPGMLPPFGKLPVPRGFPTFRDLKEGMPGGPRNEGRNECELQEKRDRDICGRQPTMQDKAICHASASERRAYCEKPGGTIGHPALDTAKRLRGTPPLRR